MKKTQSFLASRSSKRAGLAVRVLKILGSLRRVPMKFLQGRLADAQGLLKFSSVPKWEILTYRRNVMFVLSLSPPSSGRTNLQSKFERARCHNKVSGA